jgi:hypothetical protein
MKWLCLLNNNKGCNYFHQFYMLLRTQSMWKVFAPNYVTIPIELKVGNDPILNLLQLDSKQELV